MKAELGIRGFDQLLLDGQELRDAVIHRATIGLLGQPQVILVMTRLGFEQAVVELSQLLIQRRSQRGKTLTGSGLNNGTDDLHIDQPPRIFCSHRFPQAGGIPCR